MIFINNYIGTLQHLIKAQYWNIVDKRDCLIRLCNYYNITTMIYKTISRVQIAYILLHKIWKKKRLWEKILHIFFYHDIFYTFKNLYISQCTYKKIKRCISKNIKRNWFTFHSAMFTGYMEAALAGASFVCACAFCQEAKRARELHFTPWFICLLSEKTTIINKGVKYFSVIK